MNPERLRQIAILVDSLDTAQADRLLEQLPEAAQQQVRNAVFNLTDIDEQERKSIIQDFVQRKKSEPTVSVRPGSNAPAGTYGDPRSTAARAYMSSDLAGTSASSETSTDRSVPEYQKYLNRREPADSHSQGLATRVSLGSDLADDRSTVQQRNTASEPDLVDALSQADIETLAAVVIKETPQVLAVVLSMLPAEKSTRLLELFPASQRLDALRRLSQLDEIDEQVLDYLQQQLDRVVRRRIKLKRNQRSGPQALAAILSAAHRLNSNEVVSSIHQQFRTTDSKPDSARETTHLARADSLQVPLAAAPRPEHRVPSTKLNTEESIASQLLKRAAEVTNPSVPRPTNPSQVDGRQKVDGRQENEHPSRSLASVSGQQEERLASAEVNQVDAFSDAEIRFDFSQLAHCDRSSLESLLATAKPKLTLLALRGASPKLMTRVLKLLPTDEAKEVEYRIQNLGPTRLQDIQQAQAYLLRLASVLQDMGRFRQPRKSLLSF